MIDMASWKFIAAGKFSEVICASFTGVSRQLKLFGNKRSWKSVICWIYLFGYSSSLFHL